MRPLLNGEHPANPGRTCRVAAAQYHDLVDLVQHGGKTVELMEAGEIECGWLTPLNDGERGRFNLPDDIDAVVYWRDGDDCDPTYELRELSKSEADTITSQCEHVLVTAVCRHYHENGGEGRRAPGVLTVQAGARTAAAASARRREHPERATELTPRPATRPAKQGDYDRRPESRNDRTTR